MRGREREGRARGGRARGGRARGGRGRMVELVEWHVDSSCISSYVLWRGMYERIKE